MSLKDRAKSITKRLANISRQRNVPFQNILTEFLIERLVARLVADKKNASKLIFKGGFVGLKVYHSKRYTVDLDAIMKFKKAFSSKKLIRLSEIDLDDAVWFAFQEEFDLKTQGDYGGIRLVFRAGIGEKLTELKRAQVINLDIGFGDPVTPEPKVSEIKTLLDDQSISWIIYPLETTIAEKLQALISRGAANSRSKDIFDLYQYLPHARVNELKTALKATFEYCKTPLPTDMVAALKEINLNLLERGWAQATQDISDTPTCRECFASVIIEIQRFSRGAV